MLNRRGELTILLYEKEKYLYVNERIISVVFLDVAPLFFFFLDIFTKRRRVSILS